MTTVRATAANPVMLTWARERAGLRLEDVGARLGCDASRVLAWEQGVDAPTYRQLQDLARYLKRPLAMFFFDTPPEESDDGQEFRLSPGGVDADAMLDTRFAIREVRARQLRIGELTGGVNPSGDRFLLAATNVTANSLRGILGVTVEQQLAWPDSEAALKGWRTAVEAVGVSVFKRSYKQKAISGLSVWDPVVPAISINNGTTWNRQIFTLFHELAHIVFRMSGVTRADVVPSTNAKELEGRCNRFAADFLLPVDAVKLTSYSGLRSLDSVARRFHVSRDVVIRRLYDEKKVTAREYENAMKRILSGYFARKVPEKGGGNYYATVASYLGPGYLRLAFSAFHARRIDLYELADSLGIRPSQIPTLERFAGESVS